MLPSRYNLIHALAAAAVLLTVVFWQGLAPFWRQFVYGLAVPMTPMVMLQTFLLTAVLFGTLWLVLWASSLFAGHKGSKGIKDTTGRMPRDTA